VEATRKNIPAGNRNPVVYILLRVPIIKFTSV